MEVASWIVGLLLLGQVSFPVAPFDTRTPPVRPPAGVEKQAPSSAPASNPAEHRPADALTNVPARAIKGSAPDLLAEILQPAADRGAAAVKGRPWMLLEIVSRFSDRSTQLRAIQAYWKLAASVAEDRYSWDEYRSLAEIEFPKEQFGGPEDDARLPDGSIGLASAKARLRESQLTLATAQYDLSDLLRLPAGVPLPIPSDLPFTGLYRTHFDVLYANRAPSLEIRLIERTLPLRRQAIDARSVAVRAAMDAFESMAELYRRNSADLPLVRLSWQELVKQRRAFMALVRDYNRDIAQYALTSAPSGLSNVTLVGMLVQPQRGAGNGVIQASGSEPLDARESEPAGSNPAPAGSGNNGSPPAQFGPQSAVDPNWKHFDEAAAAVRSAGKQIDGQESFSVGLYSALAELSPSKRSVGLADALYWDRGVLPKDPSMPITLADCLAAVSSSDRRTVISAYWRAREQAARYQALVQRSEQLATLFAPVLHYRQHSGGAEAMLRLREVRSAAAADLLEAHAELLAARGRLTEICHRPITGAWLMPNTAPHAGGYRLRVDSQGNLLAKTPAEQRLVALLPIHKAAIDSRSAAVVAIDSACAAECQQFEATGKGFETALKHIEQESVETTMFLSDVTLYNLDIAEYALSELPGNASVATLVPTLVELK